MEQVSAGAKPIAHVFVIVMGSIYICYEPRNFRLLLFLRTLFLPHSAATTASSGV